MTYLPLLTLLVCTLTLLVLVYVAGRFVRLYDLLTPQNKRIALASVFCMLFTCLERGIRSFCVVFALPMPEALQLLEMGSALFALAWIGFTLLEIESSLLIDLQMAQETWEKKEL
jgi:hypothetical protein